MPGNSEISSNVSQLLKTIMAGQDASQQEVEVVFQAILDHDLGPANDVTFGALFAALQTKGPTEDEIAGLTNVVLQYDRRAITCDIDPDTLCGIVGSGKDDLKTFNVSTCAAIVASAAGVNVVKNGSRSESSVAGTTDVLEHLEFPIHLSDKDVVALLRQTQFTFCDAEPCFPRMSKEYVGKFLFPHPLSYTLSIASGLSFGRIVFGISFPETEKVAHILQKLGIKYFMVVAGQNIDGKTLDEISNIGPTKISESFNGQIRTYTLLPTDVGLPLRQYEEIKQGKTVSDNAQIFVDVLQGKRSDAALDIVCMNAGALLYLNQNVSALEEGVSTAKNIVKTGQAYEHFQKILNVAQGYDE